MASEPHTLQPRVSAGRYRFRWHSAAFLATMFALAMIAMAAVVVSSRASSTPLLDDHAMSASRALATTRLPEQIQLARAGELNLMLPVFQEEVTAIGYHPVDGEGVVIMSPSGRQINGSILSNLNVFSDSDGPGYFLMSEGGLQGSATCSMDVGAPAGTMVFAPVDGTIAGIRSYNLKGQCPDTEIKIQPQNQTRLLVVMTHMINLEASLGQPVRAGETRLGAVRKMDGCVEQQLSQYTYDSGNHLHLQVEHLKSNSRP